MTLGAESTARQSLALELDRQSIDGVGGAQAGTFEPPPADYPWRRPMIEEGRLRRVRRWLEPDVEALVGEGDRVEAGDAIARFIRAGRAGAVDVAGGLGVPIERASAFCIHGEGEMVAAGEVLAERRTLGGLQRRQLRAPVAGHVSFLSPQTGALYVQPPPVEFQTIAHLGGTVVQVAPTGAVIEGDALAIGATAGAGQAAAGTLLFASTHHDIPEPETATGTIVVCPFVIDEGIVQAVADAGAAALVAAGIDEATLTRLGWDALLWPRGVTGGLRTPASPPFTIVLLGIGTLGPPAGAWELLEPLSGRRASALGSEPGAAPELIVDVSGTTREAGRRRAGGTAGQGTDIGPGVQVRVLAGRADGLIGRVVDVADVPQRLASEVSVDAAVVELPYQGQLVVPLIHLQPMPQ